MRPPKSGVCFAFMRGECNRGDACRFNHTAGEEVYPMPQQSAPYGGTPTGFCFAFQRGECFRGDACKYSHSMPPIGGGQVGDYMNPYGGGYHQPSRRPCFAFQRGECTHGDACRFAHITADGRLIQNGFPVLHRPSRKPCFAFLNTGACERGDACRFSHDGNTMMNPPQFNPMGGMGAPGGVCFAFQRGQCQRGEACRYAHIAPGMAPLGMPLGMPVGPNMVYDPNVPQPQQVPPQQAPPQVQLMEQQEQPQQQPPQQQVSQPGADAQVNYNY